MGLKLPELYRQRIRMNGEMRLYEKELGELNCFVIPFEGRSLHVMASIDNEWEHVSVSLSNRCPNWREMCHIKDLFWEAEEMVMQFHPKKSEYVNYMQYCLHMWKPPAHVENMIDITKHYFNQETETNNAVPFSYK